MYYEIFRLTVTTVQHGRTTTRYSYVRDVMPAQQAMKRICQKLDSDKRWTRLTSVYSSPGTARCYAYGDHSTTVKLTKVYTSR